MSPSDNLLLLLSPAAGLALGPVLVTAVQLLLQLVPLVPLGHILRSMEREGIQPYISIAGHPCQAEGVARYFRFHADVSIVVSTIIGAIAAAYVSNIALMRSFVSFHPAFLLIIGAGICFLATFGYMLMDSRFDPARSRPLGWVKLLAVALALAAAASEVARGRGLLSG